MNSHLPGVIYPGVNSAPATLKRARSGESYHRKFNGQRLPPLPHVNSDLILQVFTHKSLRRLNVPPEDYGDNERLATLGNSVFEVAITYTLFQRRPMLKAMAISKYRETLSSGPMIEDWVNFYKLRNKLLCHPSALPFLNVPQETNSIFYAYLGGICLTSGPQAVNVWVRDLVEQELESLPDELESETKSESNAALPLPKRAKSELAFSPEPPNGPPIFFASQPPPSPPTRPPPPYVQRPIASVIPPNPMAPAQPNLPFLPLFKQAALQRRVTVEYLAEFSGPSHAGRWVVKCIVNGISKGEGTGANKHIAKEEAARKAYYSMGWT